jgi:hypothetical protein
MRGGQWQALYLILGLRERGHEVRLLARRGCELFARAEAEGLAVAPATLGRVATGRQWADVVHAHDARTHTLAAIAGGRFVVSRRVAFAVRTGVFSRLKYARAAAYIAVSHFVAGKLIEAGIKSDAITVVYDGVALPGTVLPADGDRVIAPATADPMKGSDLLRDASSVAGVVPHFSDNLQRDLPGARVFVYLTREEGLGSAALLAMAHGVPVVASRAGGLLEAIEDGRTGLLVENRPEEIARAIRSLLDDPGRAAEMGRAGRDRAERLFSIVKMVDETVDVYKRVLE